MSFRSSLWLCLLLAAPALAQEEGEAAQEEVDLAPQKWSGVIEEIVVTAQRREENIQEVPVAVTLIDGGDALPVGQENATRSHLRLLRCLPIAAANDVRDRVSQVLQDVLDTVAARGDERAPHARPHRLAERRPAAVTGGGLPGRGGRAQIVQPAGDPPPAQQRDGPGRLDVRLAIVREAGGGEVLGEAENGQQAVTMARKLAPDVILMDLVMPEMDGIEATRLPCVSAHSSPSAALPSSTPCPTVPWRSSSVRHRCCRDPG